jgi:protocatechuate 3,4-dioxygenase, beta subunit
MSERRSVRRGEDRSFPPFLFPVYRSTTLRAPSLPLVEPPRTISEMTGPGPALAELVEPDADLTSNAGTGGVALGERIIVTGTLRDAAGDPVPNAVIEIWQANAAGRYLHDDDRHDAPLDPNFTGIGRCLTDETGAYRFLSVRPGAYPWGNHLNAWRPSHVHLSIFGPSFSDRLVTQMYFPGDPLQAIDPIFNAVPDPAARDRLVARYDHQVTEPDWALGFRFDVRLAGPTATPFDDPDAPHGRRVHAG